MKEGFKMKKVKKITALILVLIMLLSAVPITASAASVNDLYYEIVNGKVTITACKDYASGELSIPSKIEGYSVTSIGDWAFECCEKLTNISIPDSVTVIGEHAFDSCLSLESITIPDSVTDIGEGAFESCKKLKGVTIPNSITTISFMTFAFCDSLTYVIIPEGITNIENFAFHFCYSLEKIAIPSTVKSIGEEFSGCKNLKSITVDKNNPIYDSRNNCNAVIETATNTLLFGCQNTKIPDSIKIIGSSAFEGCENLENITIPSGVKTISNFAFAYCTGLRGITISDSVSNIDYCAFTYCNNLTDVYYNGTKKQWNNIEIDEAENENLLNATIHFKEPAHTHTYTHISIYASCTVDGMEYDICSDCGDVINSKVLTATGHSWGEWKTVLEPTGTTDGRAERKCTKCGDVETKVIAKLNVVKDEDTGIEIEYRDQFDTDIEIKVEEKFDGKSFQLVDTTYPDSKTQIFDITTYENGVKVQPDGVVTVRIPLPDGFGTKNIFVCYIDTESQNVTQIPAKVVDGFVEFTAEHFSEYAVVELSGKAEKVSVSDITVNYKDSAKITPNVTIDGDVKYTTSFTSSDTSVATIDKDGRVTTLHKGITTITCTVTDEYGNTVKDTCTVTVKLQWWQWIIWILLFGFLWY